MDFTAWENRTRVQLVEALSAEKPWQRREAEERRQELLANCREDGRPQYTLEGGVMRWTSNRAVPPLEIVGLAKHIGIAVDESACDAARDADTKAFFQQYRKARANRSPEQRAEEAFELRAAFGPGQEVVDIITGERTRT